MRKHERTREKKEEIKRDEHMGEQNRAVEQKLDQLFGIRSMLYSCQFPKCQVLWLAGT